jgi:hypothetical protein
MQASGAARLLPAFPSRLLVVLKRQQKQPNPTPNPPHRLFAEFNLR